MGTKAKGSVYEVITETGEDGRRLAPTSISKSDAESLWAEINDGTPAVKVRFTCGDGAVIEQLPSTGSRNGVRYTYGSVIIQCAGNNNPCSVSGLSCANFGGDTSTNDVEHTVICNGSNGPDCYWVACPPINTLQGGPQSCDPSLSYSNTGEDGCEYDTTPKDPCDISQGYNTEIVTCDSSGAFPQLPIYDYCCEKRGECGGNVSF